MGKVNIKVNLVCSRCGEQSNLHQIPNTDGTFGYTLLCDTCLKATHGKTVQDYIYCEDCQCLVDFWKYDHNIADAGHEDCHWRYVTEAELVEAVQDCEANGCFNEDILGVAP
jgi:hypothetical protein